MSTHTKIVCTIGPAVAHREKVEQLIKAGMNVARLNFSHGTHQEHAEVIALLKQVRQELAVPLAIMLDTKGPEIRLGKFKKKEIHLHTGDHIWLIKEVIEGDEKQVTLVPEEVLNVLQVGMTVLLDNGYVIAKVIEIAPQGVCVRILNGGVLASTRGVNIPEAPLDLPAMTLQDVEDIKFGCRNDVDYIAASFIRSAEHVMIIKKLLEEEKKSDISLIAKIENRMGVHNFDSILQVADGIMIARGDLGVELPLTEVPRLQKMMIRKCYLMSKLCITATQMLESMIFNPRPTRAEASDVANAIYDSTSAVMLSGETAIGSYPIETVSVMRAIVAETERDFNYYEFFQSLTRHIFHDVPSSVAQASIKTAYSANAKAIFAFSTSGSTARLLSRWRPEIPIIAMTPSPKVFHQLSIVWGVTPLLCTEASNIEEAYKQITKYALDNKLVKYGDLVVIIAGTPFGRPGTTNMIIVDSIGDVLLRGREGYGPKVHGQVAIIHSPENIKEYTVKDKVIVITSCNESYLHLLKNAAGVILQNSVEDYASERYLTKLATLSPLSILLQAEGAIETLREGQLVTLDAEQALVYKGIVPTSV